MTIDFTTVLTEKSLIGTLANQSMELYENCVDCDDNSCNHLSGCCSGSCLKCMDEVNYPNKRPHNGRSLYNCQKLVYYYTCRYSWKYCSEIMYALESIALDDYPYYKILSLGCGAAPDLMAFEQINSKYKKKMGYRGCDINPLWENLHKKIEAYCSENEIAKKFETKDVFDVLSEMKNFKIPFNVVIMQYLISSFPNNQRANLTSALFEGLINNVISKKRNNEPLLVIINDLDHNTLARNYFQLLLSMLKNRGFHGSVSKRHFTTRSKDYGDKSVQYKNANNKFIIPYAIEKFDCAVKCSSAQIIIEVR